MNPKLLFEQPGKRFFFDDSYKIAQYVYKNCPNEAKEVIAAADEVAAQRFRFALRWDMERTNKPVVFEKDIEWLYQPGDDPEWVFAFNRMRFWICLGQAYALTYDEKYAYAFVKQLIHWVYHVKKEDPTCDKAWRSIEVGFRLEYWLKAMQYFKGSPAITDEVADIFTGSIIEQAEFIMGIWNGYNIMSNWGILANHGLFMAGAMLPETKRTKEYTAEAVRRLLAEINMQVYRDGSHWEQSPMYHNEVLHCFLDVALLAKRTQIQLPEELIQKTLAMCLYDVANAKPNHAEPMMGDSDDIDQRDRISRGALIFQHPELKARGYELPDFDTIWEIGEEGLEAYQNLSSKLPKQTDFFLPDSGNMYLRSGWSESSTWVHYQCGPLGAGHGHADKLHIDVFSRGEDVLMDAGRYTYSFNSGRTDYKKLQAHNTLMVDNHDLYICKDSWECERLTRAVNQKFYADQRFGYAEGGHLGYLSLSDGVFLNRRIIFLKPDIVIASDEFYSAGSHKYNQFFHFAEHGELTEDQPNGWHYHSGNVSAQLSFITPHIKSNLIDTTISRHYNEQVPAKGIKTEFLATGSGCAFTVLALSDPGVQKALRVEKLPVMSHFKGIQFKDEEIEALNIYFGEQHFTVVIAHKEYATPTDTFLTDGCMGFGSAVVFDRKAEGEAGTVLAW